MTGQAAPKTTDRLAVSLLTPPLSQFMQPFLECLPCLIRQAVDSSRLITSDEHLQERILRETLAAASRMDLSQPPAVMAQHIHRRIRELTGQPDPYRKSKIRFNQLALGLYPELKQRVRQASDPLETAVRLAIAGNVIDLGVKSGLSDSQVHATIEESLDAPLDGRVEELAEAIRRVDKILYLTDNAGEIVFDRLLIEEMPVEKVTVAVKGHPVINDATKEDAEAVGLPQVVKVIDNGSDAPGTVLDDTSESFRRHFAEADLILSKGQGNFETLRESPKRVFFLLRVKCPVIARDLGCPLGAMVLRASDRRTAGLFPDGNSTNQ